jgi:hypothetical protein
LPSSRAILTLIDYKIPFILFLIPSPKRIYGTPHRLLAPDHQGIFENGMVAQSVTADL